MSTKSTIKYGKIDDLEFHLYQECFEDDGVYLEIRGNVDFSATANSVNIKIPLALWEVIRQGQHSIFQDTFAGKTDAELLKIVTADVDKRILAHKKGDDWTAMMGIFVYGDAKNPRAMQIKDGMKEAKRIRNFVAGIHQRIQSLERPKKSKNG